MASDSLKIYLDHNATAPLRPEAKDAFLAALEECGNPSSVHSAGRRARAHLSKTRLELAKLLDTRENRIVFTSGCTEANMHVLTPFYRLDSDYEELEGVLVGATEHPSVLQGGRFSEVNRHVLPVDECGHIRMEVLADTLNGMANNGKRMLVSVMAANNETGIVQPMEEISRIVKGAGGILHVDATQIVGRRSVAFSSLGCDLLTLSAHKLGGPLGVGVVAMADGHFQPAPLIAGGGQEYYHRSGTENVAAIAGFGAVVEKIPESVANMGEIGLLRDHIEIELRKITPGIVFFGDSVDRIENTCCFAVPGVSAETALIACDLEGVELSSGSACSSGKVGISHVLEAMGVSREVAQCALRISLGWSNTKEEVERFLQKWRSVIGRLNPQSVDHAA